LTIASGAFVRLVRHAGVTMTVGIAGGTTAEMTGGMTAEMTDVTVTTTDVINPMNGSCFCSSHVEKHPCISDQAS